MVFAREKPSASLTQIPFKNFNDYDDLPLCRKDSRRRPRIGYHLWNKEKLCNADYLAIPRTVKDEEMYEN